MKNIQDTMTFCISGSPSPTIVCPPEALDIGKVLGKACAEKGLGIMSISTTGFPLWVALAAAREGATTIAFSPATSAREHGDIFKLPVDGFHHVIYTGFGTSGASVLSLRSSDAIIFGCGGMSSVLECVTAIQEGKPIGILEGPWETDEVLENMLKEHYPDYEHVIIDTDPYRLVEQMIKRVKLLRDAS
ncbi:hypothetical protein H6776_01615 [Candidatus Nomurabacteria bacterium]|nr:hypothetical protein [Candidatus Nomurabacteria bacterium]